jgi:hypothetical protein
MPHSLGWNAPPLPSIDLLRHAPIKLQSVALTGASIASSAFIGTTRERVTIIDPVASAKGFSGSNAIALSEVECEDSGPTAEYAHARK